MLERTVVREQKRGGVPAVVHVDGSARPQTVTPTDNAVLHRLLKEWERQTGVPMLINTSFNTEAEPIVCSPADALRTFAERGINSLALGPFLVRKENINERPCDRTTLRR